MQNQTKEAPDKRRVGLTVEVWQAGEQMQSPRTLPRRNTGTAKGRGGGALQPRYTVLQNFPPTDRGRRLRILSQVRSHSQNLINAGFGDTTFPQTPQMTWPLHNSTNFKQSATRAP